MEQTAIQNLQIETFALFLRFLLSQIVSSLGVHFKEEHSALLQFCPQNKITEQDQHHHMKSQSNATISDAKAWV